MFNTDIWKGKWKQASGAIKAKYADLTDDEIGQLEGNAEKLAGLMQEKYGWTKEEAEDKVAELEKEIDKMD